MKSPRPRYDIRKCSATLLLTVLAAFSHLSAANYTWDVNSTNAATIDNGNGTWDTNVNNLVWNNAGTNVAWSQSNATSSPHNATFAGDDAVGNSTYTITLGTSVGVGTSSAGLLRFSNNGTVITAPEAAGQTLTVLRTSVDVNKTATFAGNVTLVTTSTASMFTGYGTLVARDGAKLNTTGNVNFGLGSKTRLENGSVFTATGSVIVGNQAADGSTTTLTVAGGNLNISGSGLSLALTNLNSITGAYSNTIVTLASGNITNNSSAGGVRFGGSSANATFNTNVNGILNLDGGVLTAARLHEADGVVSTKFKSTLNFNGGTLRVLSSSTNTASFLRNLDTATVKANGAIIDTNGTATTIGQALLTEMSGNVSTGGGLTKIGNGTLTLTGNNTYTGNTTVSVGTLAINSPYSALSQTVVAPSARLQINSGASASTIPALDLQGGSGLVLNLGIYSGGNVSSTGVTTLTANGNYTIDLTGTNIPVGNYTVMTYGSKAGDGVPILGQMPPGVVAAVSDSGNAINLNVTSPQVHNAIWAAGNGTWDTVTSANWTPSVYVEGGIATFPNITGNSTVTLSGPRSPFSLAIQNTGANTYTFTGSAISGNASVTKTGTGLATLEAANSYAGQTTVSEGVLAVSTNGALGSIAENTTISAGASLAFTNGVNYSAAESIVVPSGNGYAATFGSLPFAASRGSIQVLAGAVTVAGNITLAGDGARFGVQNVDGASLTLSGTISTAPGLINNGVYFRAGNLDGNFIILSGAGNNWSGNTSIYASVNSGVSGVRLGTNNALPITTSVNGGGIGSGTGNSLDLNGFNQTLGGLMSSSSRLQITNLSSTPSVLTLDTSTADFTNEVGMGSTAGEFTVLADGQGGLSLVKKGAFKQTLDGTHYYSGNTTIEAGTLAITGTGFLQATPITMMAGSTFDVSTIGSVGSPRTDFALSGGLSGSGNLTATGKTVTVSTTFAPGALAVSGNLTLAVGTATTLVASTTAGISSAVALTDGTLTLSGNLAINPAGGFAFATGQSFTFATGTIVAGLNGVSVAGNALSGAAGVWTATFGGLDYTFTEASATLAVSGGIVISPLQAWRDIHFPGAGNDGTGIGANNFDADNDGIANLLEYATNTSPVAANASVVTQGNDAGRLTLTFPRIDDHSLRYTVEGRSDLVAGTWAAITPASPATNNPTYGFTGSTSGVVETASETVIDSVLIATAGKRFLRLSVDLVP